MNISTMTTEADRQRTFAAEAETEAIQVEKELAECNLDDALGDRAGGKRLLTLENRRAGALKKAERATLAAAAAERRLERMREAEAQEQRKEQIARLTTLCAQRAKISSDLDETVVELREQLEALAENADLVRETLKELGGAQWQDVRAGLRSQALNRVSHVLRPLFRNVAGFPGGPEVESLRDATSATLERVIKGLGDEGLAD